MHDTGLSETSRNILFVCSRNQWRSPTAETIWSEHPGLRVRSAGTSSSARRRVTEADIVWADLVLVMEKKHKQQIAARFPDVANEVRVVNLDIPDVYQYMDPELVETLQVLVSDVLGL
jgi:predicted protein tyrosine phosphatase